MSVEGRASRNGGGMKDLIEEAEKRIAKCEESYKFWLEKDYHKYSDDVCHAIGDEIKTLERFLDLFKQRQKTIPDIDALDLNKIAREIEICHEFSSCIVKNIGTGEKAHDFDTKAIKKILSGHFIKPEIDNEVKEK